MAETIKGINVVIGAETTGLSKALTDVNKKSRDIQSELRQVDKLLKLDPGNTELLAQKQKLLGDAVSNTREKLDRLKAAQAQVNEQFRNGEISEGQYRAFQREIEGTEQQLKSLQGQLKNTKVSLEQIGQSMKNAGESMTSAGKKLSAGLTAPLVGLGALVLKTGIEFEASMSKVEAVSGSTKEEMKVMTDQAKELGATTVFSASQAASGMEFLARAGWDARDVMAAMPGMLDLAAAGALELGTAADITSNIMSAFSIEANKAGHVADVMAAANANANTNVEQLGLAMTYLAPTASTMGQSLEEATAAVMKMSDAGIQGEKAGAAFSTSLQRLAKPTNAMYEVMDQLKISFFDAQGSMKPLSQIVGELETSMKGYTKEQRANALATLFGAEAYKNWAVLVETGSDALSETVTMLENADGAAKQMADTMLDNAKGGIVQLQSALEGIAIQLSEILIPIFNAVVQKVQSLVDWFASLGSSTQRIVVFAAMIAAAIGPLLIILGQMSIGLGALLPMLSALISPIGLIIAGVAALAAGLVYLYNTNETVRDALNAAWVAIKAAAEAVFGALKSFWATWGGEITSIFTSFWNTLKQIFNTVLKAISDVVKSIFAGIKSFWATWGTDITAFFRTTWNVLSTLFNTVFKAILEAIKFVFNEIKAFWEKWGTTITAAFKGVFEILKTVIGTAVNVIFTVIKTVFTSIKSFWDTWGATITTVFRTVFNTVKTVFSGAWNAIKIVVETAIGVISGVIKTWLAIFKGDWSGAWEAAKGVAQTVWKGITGIFSNAFNTMKDIGKNIIQGLVQGIANMKDVVVQKAKEISEAIGGFFKKFFDIHSPSKLTTGYGENIGQGLANGISNKTKTAAAAAKKAATQVNNAFKSAFSTAQFNFKMGYVDVAGHIAALEKVKSTYAKTSAQVQKATLEIKKAHDQQAKAAEKAAKDSFASSKAYIDSLASTGKITREQELAMWERVQAKYKAGTAQHIAAEKEAYKLKKEMAKASFEASKEYIEKGAAANELSLAQQLTAWERVQARFKAGTAEAKAAEEEAGKVKLEIYNQLTQASEDFLAKTKEINANVAAEELRLNDVYEQAVEQRAKAINDFAGLFDEVVAKSETSGQQLLDNLRGQVDYLATWASNIEELAARGIDKGLLEELRQMGPKAAPELAALNTLTDEQLAEYTNLWKTKSSESRALAVQELTGLREDTDKQITQLRADAVTQLDGLKSDFDAKVKEIRYGTTNQFNAMKSDLPNIGKQAMQGLLDGLSSMQGAVQAKAKSIADSVRTTMQKALDIHSPSREMKWIGEMAGAGLVQGMANMMSNVQNQAREMAQAVKPSVGNSKGGTDSGTTPMALNMEGLFAGAVFQVRSDEDIRSLAKELAAEMFMMAQQASRGTGGAR